MPIVRQGERKAGRWVLGPGSPGRRDRQPQTAMGSADGQGYPHPMPTDRRSGNHGHTASGRCDGTSRHKKGATSRQPLTYSPPKKGALTAEGALIDGSTNPLKAREGGSKTRPLRLAPSLAPQKSEEGPRRAPRGFALSRARRWSAASCSPTGWTGSTIGARGLNFRVRHGTGCSPPAMAADRRRARGGRVASAPSGPHSDAKRSSRTVPGKNGRQELGLLVPLG